jgi:hypothetical protein
MGGRGCDTLEEAVTINDNNGDAEVYVNCTDNPVRLENDVETDHNLTKAIDDDKASDLTPEKGSTDE